MKVVRVLMANKQFAAAVGVVLVAVGAFPGSPGRSLLDRIVTSPPTSVVAAPAAPAPTVPFSPPLSRTPDLAGPTTAAAPTTPGPPLEPPPAGPPEAPAACAADVLADAIESVRGPLGEATGKPIPGESVEKLAAIAAGCSDADPTVPVLDLALELAALAPDPGLDPVDLPDLPAIGDLPIPKPVIGALKPVAEPIRTGCQNLAVIAVVFIVLPPAFYLPFSSSDLIQFLGPATALCALFDEDPS